MSWFFKLLDTAGVNQAGVDTNNNVKANLPTTKAQAGFAALGGRNDDGVVTGTALVNRVYVSEANGLKVVNPNFLWDDTFNATAQNTSNYRAPITTMTVTYTGGYVIINGGNITSINTNAAYQTYRVFPLIARAELRCCMKVLRTAAPQVNCAEEMGLFNAALPGAAVPTDGVFFRWTTVGTLRGVLSFAGTEIQTAVLTSPSINVNHDYTIVTQANVVRFYIDDVLQASLTLLTDQPTFGKPLSSAAVPFTIRQYIGGSAPGAANQLKLSDLSIMLLGPDTSRGWETVNAGYGKMAYQGQNGNTMGTTALLPNNTVPGAAVPTNTTAALGSGLGGFFLETVSLAVGTDGIICSYQNPVGSAIITPRNLIISGVRIGGIVHTVLAATIWNALFYLAYGHTTVSLATAEAATTKAPRRIALPGCFGAAASAAAGTVITGAPVSISFNTPIAVSPGEFIAIASRKVTAAPATGAIMWSIMFDGYFE